MSVWFILLCAVVLIAYAALGGVFLAFSDFIMRSLDLVRNQSGIEAMQVINVEIMRSVFMVLFMGMAVVSIFLVIYAWFYVDGVPGRLIMLSGAVYFAGVFVLTAAGNVPLNNTLAGLEAQTAAALSFWKESYMTRWVGLNSVRTLACFLASGLTLAALVIR
ncbi:MAG: DUF1772 domain-containing protein [Hoeflea sp.]|uniref:anthrone oxygenase family protein n=1 Tax=Hoeflea sp. TaxID=1940281 RepID=UPI0032EED64E